MNVLLAGAVGMGFVTASLFFLRFWRTTGDRFFLFFALSFFLEGVNRVALYPAIGVSEQLPLYYVIRLLSYGLILVAVLDKNRSKR